MGCRVTTKAQLERAIIEAARRYVSADPYNLIGSASDPGPVALANAVLALDAWTEPEVTEILWNQLAEGDQLKSVRNGRFYAVERTAAMKDGIHVKLAGIAREIVRPTPAEPRATVRRGATGQAVDMFVTVLSSGGK